MHFCLAFILIFFSSCSQFEKLKNPSMHLDESEIIVTNHKPEKEKMVVLSADATLRKIIETSLEKSPQIGIIKARIEAAHSRINLAIMEYYPEINISAGIRHNWNRERFLPISKGEDPVFAYNYMFADLAVRVPIYTGGSSRYTKDALRYEQSALKYSLKRAEQQLVFEIVRLWYLIIRNRLIRDELELSVKNLKKIRDITAMLVKEKKAPKLKLAALDTRMGQLEYEKIRINGVISSLFSALSSCSGADFPPGAEKNWKLNEKLPEFVSDKDFYSIALGNRHDVRELFRRIAAQELSMASKRSTLMPSVYGVLSYGYRMNTDADHGDTGFAGIEVSFPFLNWFKVNAQIREEVAKLKILTETMRELKRKIKQEVSDALLALKTAQAMITSSAHTVKYATLNYEITKKKSDLSIADATELLLAHQELLVAKSNYYKAITDWYMARAKLFFAAGIDK